MSKLRWKFVPLPSNSKSGCQVEGCKKYADYNGTYGKPNGLFQFTGFKLCAYHKMYLTWAS